MYALADNPLGCEPGEAQHAAAVGRTRPDSKNHDEINYRGRRRHTDTADIFLLPKARKETLPPRHQAGKEAQHLVVQARAKMDYSLCRNQPGDIQKHIQKQTRGVLERRAADMAKKI
jgi:hypothetical protein